MAQGENLIPWNHDLFRWALNAAKVPPYSVLPRWARMARFVLMPIKVIRWWARGREGYQLLDDTWLIHGVSFSDQWFHDFINGRTGYVKVIRKIESPWGTLLELHHLPDPPDLVSKL